MTRTARPGRAKAETRKLIALLGPDAGEEKRLIDGLRSMVVEPGILRIRLNAPAATGGDVPPAGGIGGLVEAWGEKGALERLAHDLRTLSTTLGAYLVDVSEEKGHDVVPESGSARKVVGILLRKWDQSARDTRARWDEHVPLALRIHHGATSYTRNWVSQPLADSADVFGLAMLRFASTESLDHGYYVAPELESRAELAHDIARFVGIAIRLTVRERLIER